MHKKVKQRFFSRSLCCKNIFFDVTSVSFIFQIWEIGVLSVPRLQILFVEREQGRKEEGARGGGGGLTLKEFQESFFSATNLNYWKCKLNFLKHLLNSKEMKHVQSLSKKLLISYLLLSFFPVLVLFIVGVLKFIIALYLYVIRQSVCYCFVFKFLLLSSLVVLFLIL